MRWDSTPARLSSQLWQMRACATDPAAPPQPSEVPSGPACWQQRRYDSHLVPTHATKSFLGRAGAGRKGECGSLETGQGDGKGGEGRVGLLLCLRVPAPAHNHSPTSARSPPPPLHQPVAEPVAPSCRPRACLSRRLSWATESSTAQQCSSVLQPQRRVAPPPADPAAPPAQGARPRHLSPPDEGSRDERSRAEGSDRVTRGI